MKTTRLIVAVCICLSLGSMAQGQPQVALGIATGLNYNMHTGSDLPARATGAGLVIGGQADIAFSRSVGLLTTIAFDNKLGKYSASGTEAGYYNTEDVEVTVAYLSIEPLFKYIIPDRPWYIVTGPCMGIPIQGNSQTILTTPGFAVAGYESTTINTTIGNLKPRFEWKIGAAYFFQIDKQTVLALRLTYARALTDVQKGVD